MRLLIQAALNLAFRAVESQIVKGAATNFQFSMMHSLHLHQQARVASRTSTTTLTALNHVIAHLPRTISCSAGVLIDQHTNVEAVLPQLRGSRAARKRRGSKRASVDVQPRSASELLDQRVSVMPGVGPKYEQLLATHNIKTVQDLLKMHIHEHGRQMEVTQRFLRETVGINNSGCIRSMAAYMIAQHNQLQSEGHSLVTGANNDTIPSWLKPKVTLSVEGNISAGKSTFLNILGGSGLMDTKLQVVQEPVDQWQNVGNEGVNLLMEFYKAPERMAYAFQNYVFLTRMMKERESYTASSMCRLLERSVFSDKMVFVRSVHAAKHLSDTELAIYNSWFDPILSTLPTLIPNGFIYLRASPTTCHQRLKRRARSEEATVGLDYLQALHSNHEDWLVDGGDPVSHSPDMNKYIWVHPTDQVLTKTDKVPPQSAHGGVLRPGLKFSIHNHAPTERGAGSRGISPAQRHLVAAARLPPVPKELDGAIRFIDTSRGSHIHPLLNTIPAFVLDCDQDVDIHNDKEYHAHVAGQVSAYCDYVRDYMVARGQAVQQHEGQVTGKPSSNGVYFPPSGSFNGYSMQVQGTTLYVDRHAPLVAFASQDSARANTLHTSGYTTTDAATDKVLTAV